MFFILITLIYQAKSETTLHLASFDWPPYTSENLPGQGCIVRELNSLLSPDGIKIKVSFLSWRRVKAQKKDSPYDGYLPAWPEEIIEGFKASTPINSSTLALIAKKGFSKKFKDTNEIFEKSKVGHVRSYDYPKSVDKFLKRYPKKVVAADSEYSLLRMLQAERIDLALADPRLVHFFKQKKEVKDVYVFKKLVDIPMLVALKKTGDYQSKLKKINERLKGARSAFCEK